MATSDPPHLPARRILGPWEAISQQTVWHDAPATQAELDHLCGETCIVMAMRWAAGIYTSAVYLHDKIWAPGQVEGTTIQQMQYLLKSQCETNTQLWYPQNPTELNARVQEMIGRGHCGIVLRYWDHPGNDLLHFCVYIGYAPGILQLAGPWSGTLFTESIDTSHAMYYGPIIEVLRKRKLGDH